MFWLYVLCSGLEEIAASTVKPSRKRGRSFVWFKRAGVFIFLISFLLRLNRCIIMSLLLELLFIVT
ncbi:MAG: BC10 family protein [Rhodospirillaceae bacterium]|nr:BC10 family protein [Rhodospirillaceae bacterium]